MVPFETDGLSTVYLQWLRSEKRRNPQYQPHDPEYVETFYRYTESETGRLYRKDNLTAAKPGGDTEYLWRVKRREEEGAKWAGRVSRSRRRSSSFT